MKILDGGIGRYLKEIGAPFQQPEWSALALMEDPSSVITAHQAFVDAGAQIITTNSYAVVPYHIGEERFKTRGAELIALAGQLAKSVKKSSSQPIKVAAGIPPVFGSYNPDEFVTADAVALLEVFKQQLLPFADIVLAETVSSIEEVIAIQKVFADCAQPLWISMTLEDDAEASDSRLRSGELLSDALSAINLDQIDAILFNCSQPEVMAKAVTLSAKRLPSEHRYWGLCQRIYSNLKYHSSQRWLLNPEDDLTPQDYLVFAQQWKALGATIIGGCCGIGPEHIALLDALKD